MRRLFLLLAAALIVTGCGATTAPAGEPPTVTPISNSNSPFDGARVALPTGWAGAAGANEGELTVAFLAATAEATGYRLELRPFGFLEREGLAGVYAATSLDGAGLLSIEAYPIAAGASLALDVATIEQIAGGPAIDLSISDGQVAERVAPIATFRAYEVPWAISLVEVGAYRYLIVASLREDDGQLLITLLRDLRLAE